MRRREFIAGFAAAAAWSIPGTAQQHSDLPMVGFLDSTSPQASAHLAAAFHKGLSEIGFVEDRNVAVEYRWAQGQYDRIPLLAAEMVRHRPAVIATPFSTLGAVEAKKLTATIPIVFATGGDPVQLGLVESLSRPGGNVTGVSSLGQGLGAKRVEILRELLPKAGRMAVLVNPGNRAFAEFTIMEVTAAASVVGWQVEVFQASSNRDLDSVFSKLAQEGFPALFVQQDVFFTSRRVQFATLATHHRIPAVYANREFVDVGRLMSYGTSYADQYRLVGSYVGRILKGEKPGDLPVMQPTRFEFVINLQTARTLGIEVPPTLLAIADEVIE